MKKLIVLLCLFIFLSCTSKNVSLNSDGIFYGESRSEYISEPFWGNAFIEVKNDKIYKVNFYIIDTQNKEVFDQNYEKHYKGNNTYIQQCRNDWSGLNKYIKQFNETRDIKKIDSISGATWSFNIFMDTMELALAKTREK